VNTPKQLRSVGLVFASLAVGAEPARRHADRANAVSRNRPTARSRASGGTGWTARG